LSIIRFNLKQRHSNYLCNDGNTTLVDSDNDDASTDAWNILKKNPLRLDCVIVASIGLSRTILSVFNINVQISREELDLGSK
jgi:hypothetical protein